MVSLQDLINESTFKQEEIAVAMNISPPTLTVYKNGKNKNNRYKTAICKKIANYFGYEIKDIKEFKNYSIMDETRGGIKGQGACTYINGKAVGNKYVELEGEYKSFKCLNQGCLLNKECKCTSPTVCTGKAPCFGKDKVQGPIREKSKAKLKQIRISRSYLETHNGYYHGSF